MQNITAIGGATSDIMWWKKWTAWLHGRPSASANVEAGLVGAGTMLAAHITDRTATRALERPMLQRGWKRGESGKAEMIMLFLALYNVIDIDIDTNIVTVLYVTGTQLSE